MKKYVLSFILLLMSTTVLAQAWGQRWHLSAGFGWQELTKKESNETYRADLALSFQLGFKQLRFTKEPIGNFMYIGIDTGLKVDYAKYTPSISTLSDEECKIKQAELGFAIGPYIQLAPLVSTDAFRVMAYYHIIPTASQITLENARTSALNFYQAFGFNLGWRHFSVGYEHRWGSASYKELQVGTKDCSTERVGYATSGNRIILRYNF